VRFYTKTAVFAFLSPFGGLGATCDDHVMFIGKHGVDFLLVLIELFSLGVTAETLRANNEYRFKIGDFTPTGASVDAKFHIEGVAPNNSLFLRKLS